MNKTGPRILTLDIETAPLQSFHWGLWQQDIHLNQIVDEWTILSFCAKWIDSKEVIYMDTGGRGKGKVRDDKALLEALWKILDEADIVIAQNGLAFDLKKINARMIMHNMLPYSPVKVIDTMLVAKKKFAFTSNKLAWMSQHLTNAKKDEHKLFPGFELWTECLKDNAKAWKEMKKYNCIDVLATEELYLKMRPWIDGHPNLAVYNDVSKVPSKTSKSKKDTLTCVVDGKVIDVPNGFKGDFVGKVEIVKCPKCDSNNLQKRGLSYTNMFAYQRFVCQDCGGWSKSRTSVTTKEKRKVLLGN